VTKVEIYPYKGEHEEFDKNIKALAVLDGVVVGEDVFVLDYLKELADFILFEEFLAYLILFLTILAHFNNGYYKNILVFLIAKLQLSFVNIRFQSEFLLKYGVCFLLEKPLIQDISRTTILILILF
jgi:hypothetical protein